MKYPAALLFFLCLFCLETSAQDLRWARSLGGTSDEYAVCLERDFAGNIYLAGNFSGTADFDPGPAVYNLTAASPLRDLFISKFDATGAFLWAKRAGFTDDDDVIGMAVDDSGNVYATGNFAGVVDFDPGPGTFNQTAVSQHDIFVLKLDSQGNFVWAKAIGGSNHQEGWAIATDPWGNILVTGSFRDTVDFDPGLGIYQLSSLGLNADIFVLKLNPAGDLIWAKAIQGTVPSYGGGNGLGLAIDNLGNVFTAGYYFYSTDFDPGPATFVMTAVGINKDAFACKWDSGGNFIWAKSFGGNSHDEAEDIALDAAGNLHVAGRFWGTADFDPGLGTFNMNALGYDDVFVCKLDSLGNLTWAKTFGGQGYDFVRRIRLDEEGNCYTTGGVLLPVDFDPGPNVHSINSGGGLNSLFISKLDSMGNFVWAQSPATNYERSAGYGLALDDGANVYVSGYFEDSIDFDPRAPIDMHLAMGGIDVIFGKFCQGNRPTISPGDTSFCLGGSVTLNASLANGYLWSPTGDTTASITVTTSGSYTVTSEDSTGCAENSVSRVVTVHPLPPVPTITQLGNSLQSNAQNGNQWFFNGVPLPSDTNQTCAITQTGNYSVVVTDINGCSSSSTVSFMTDVVAGASLDERTILYPNPSLGNLTVSHPHNGSAMIIIYDLHGRTTVEHKLDRSTTDLDLTHLPKGIYTYRILLKNGSSVAGKLVLQ